MITEVIQKNEVHVESRLIASVPLIGPAMCLVLTAARAKLRVYHTTQRQSSGFLQSAIKFSLNHKPKRSSNGRSPFNGTNIFMTARDLVVNR